MRNCLVLLACICADGEAGLKVKTVRVLRVTGALLLLACAAAAVLTIEDGEGASTPTPTKSPVASPQICSAPFAKEDEPIAEDTWAPTTYWAWLVGFGNHPLPVHARTDAEGKFYVGPVGAGTLRLLVRADGFVERTLEVTAPGPELLVTLDPAQPIAGSVRQTDGHPARHMLVLAYPPGSLAGWTPHRPATTRYSPATDASTIFAQGNAFEAAKRLPRGTYPKVAPIAGAVTDRGGRFRFSRLSQGRYDLLLVPDGSSGGAVARRLSVHQVSTGESAELVAPNAADSRARLTVRGPKKGFMIFELYDAEGRQVPVRDYWDQRDYGDHDQERFELTTPHTGRATLVVAGAGWSPLRCIRSSCAPEPLSTWATCGSCPWTALA